MQASTRGLLGSSFETRTQCPKCGTWCYGRTDIDTMGQEYTTGYYCEHCGHIWE